MSRKTAPLLGWKSSQSKKVSETSVFMLILRINNLAFCMLYAHVSVCSSDPSQNQHWDANSLRWCKPLMLFYFFIVFFVPCIFFKFKWNTHFWETLPVSLEFYIRLSVFLYLFCASFMFILFLLFFFFACYSDTISQPPNQASALEKCEFALFFGQTIAHPFSFLGFLRKGERGGEEG
jgi:hypothetical protein